MFMQIVLKAKRGSQWFDLKQFVDMNKIRDFFTMKLELRICFHKLKNEVVTSFLFAKLQICLYDIVRVFSMLCCKWPVLYLSFPE